MIGSRRGDRYRIRRAGQKDAGAISALARRLGPAFLASPDDHETAAPFLESLEPPAVCARLSDRDYFTLVVELDKKIVGLAVAFRRRHLYQLFIAPEHQRRGLGHGLWTALCRSAGLPPDCTVNAALAAVPFYRKLGFEPSAAVQKKHGVAFQPMVLSPAVAEEGEA